MDAAFPIVTQFQSTAMPSDDERFVEWRGDTPRTIRDDTGVPVEPTVQIMLTYQPLRVRHTWVLVLEKVDFKLMLKNRDADTLGVSLGPVSLRGATFKRHYKVKKSFDVVPSADTVPYETMRATVTAAKQQLANTLRQIDAVVQAATNGGGINLLLQDDDGVRLNTRMVEVGVRPPSSARRRTVRGRRSLSRLRRAPESR